LAKNIGAFTPEWCRRIMRAVVNFERMKGPGIVNGPTGVAFYQPQAPKQRTQPIERLALVRISSITGLGGRKYFGRIQLRIVNTPFSADSSNVALSSYYEDKDETDVLVISFLEPSDAGHIVAIGSRQWCRPMREVASTGEVMYELVGPGLTFACGTL
jgi:hypothetical protein